MKKLNFWLLASLFAVAFTLSACGDDNNPNDNNPPSGPTTVVGTWEAFIKASNPDDMALRYSHKLTYVFKQDGTFKMRTAYGSGNSSDQFKGEETVDFKGNYVAENGKLVFSNVTYVVTMWDGSKERGSMGNGTPLNYSLNGNTLTISSDNPDMVRFGHHHILVGTLTKSSGDIDDSENDPSSPDEQVSNLDGTWKSPFTGVTYVFSKDKLTVKDKEGLQKEGTFTLKDDVITFTYTVNGKQETASGKVITLYQNQVLVIKFKPDDGDDFSISEAAEVLYKDGIAPTTPVEDIQGNWYWYMKGDENVNRGGMMIDGNKFAMIIGPWGQKYTGTFTYQKGVMTLNITNGYTSREPHTGYGSGYGNLDPATLDGTWYVLDKDHWTMEDGMTTIFISAGTEAYSEMANLPVVYYKKDRTPAEVLEVNEETLKGTWDGSLEHDFAQGYYQRWRVQFDGKNYTSWRTHQMVGTANQADLGLQTVGSKSQGTWEYVDGALVLTPEKMWDSYYQTADNYQTMSNLRYVFNSYNTETMEASPWYEFSESIIKSCVESEKESGNPQTYMYIKYWPVVSLTAKELTVRINMDTFKLNKQ